MTDPEFHRAYEEQNRRDYIAGAVLGTCVSIPLNLFCAIMDHFMYKDMVWVFFPARVYSVVVIALVWAWFKSPWGRSHTPAFRSDLVPEPPGDDPLDDLPGRRSQIALLRGVEYRAAGRGPDFSLDLHSKSAHDHFRAGHVRAGLLAMKTPQPTSYLINNTTFLLLTSVLVVSGSVANSRQRRREFELRWELDKNRQAVEESNRKLVELDQIKSRSSRTSATNCARRLTLLLAPLETLLHRFNARSTETREFVAHDAFQRHAAAEAHQ